MKKSSKLSEFKSKNYGLHNNYKRKNIKQKKKAEFSL